MGQLLEGSARSAAEVAPGPVAVEEAGEGVAEDILVEVVEEGLAVPEDMAEVEDRM